MLNGPLSKISEKSLLMLLGNVLVSVRDAEEIPMPTAGLLLLIETDDNTGATVKQCVGSTVSSRHAFPFFPEASPVLTNTVTAPLLQGNVPPACEGGNPAGYGAVSRYAGRSVPKSFRIEELQGLVEQSYFVTV